MHTYVFAIPIESRVNAKSKVDYIELRMLSNKFPKQNNVVNELGSKLDKASDTEYRSLISAVTTINDSYSYMYKDNHSLYQNKSVWVKNCGYANLSILREN